MKKASNIGISFTASPESAQMIGDLGTGPLAVETALEWSRRGKDAALFLHTGPEPSDRAWEQLAAHDVTVVDGEVAGVQTLDGQVTGVQLANRKVIACQALVAGGPAELRDVFSPQMERDVADRVLGTSRHGM